MQIRNFCLGFAVFFLLGIGIVSAQEPETLVELRSFDRTFIDPPDIFGWRNPYHWSPFVRSSLDG